MSERESAQFSDSTNQILRALDGESVTRNPAVLRLIPSIRSVN